MIIQDMLTDIRQYDWIVTKDYTYSEEDKWNDMPSIVGVAGPSHGKLSPEEVKKQGEHWIAYDDDGERMAAGYIAGDYDGFEPLDDYLTSSLGATDIAYRNKENNKYEKI